MPAVASLPLAIMSSGCGAARSDMDNRDRSGAMSGVVISSTAVASLSAACAMRSRAVSFGGCSDCAEPLTTGNMDQSATGPIHHAADVSIRIGEQVARLQSAGGNRLPHILGAVELRHGRRPFDGRR